MRPKAPHPAISPTPRQSKPTAQSLLALQQFESDKQPGTAITPPGLSPDYRADILDFAWGRSIAKNTPELERIILW
jgi:hypothetical protein